MSTTPAITLRPYGESDLGLLRALLGDSEAMRHLGGAESESAILARHARYLSADPALDSLFVIELDTVPVGWIGFWATCEDGCEAGWHVLGSAQGQGVATGALEQLIGRARELGSCRHLDAYPGVENAASNALCRRAGFVSMGETEVEYPKGSLMRVIHWRFDLRAVDSPSAWRAHRPHASG